MAREDQLAHKAEMKKSIEKAKARKNKPKEKEEKKSKPVRKSSAPTTSPRPAKRPSKTKSGVSPKMSDNAPKGDRRASKPNTNPKLSDNTPIARVKAGASKPASNSAAKREYKSPVVQRIMDWGRSERPWRKRP